MAFVVEDDEAFSRLICDWLTGPAHTWRVSAATSGSEARRVLKTRPEMDIALVDIGLPDCSGIDIIRDIRALDPDIPILVISVFSSEKTVLSAIRSGATGYVLKSDTPQAIVSAIDRAVAGEYPISPGLARYLFELARPPRATTGHANFTPRELELLQHLSRGASYKMCADLMDISLSTVQTYVRSVYRKLGANSQVRALNEARDRGLI